MLRSLTISNYALIDELNISFEGGFSVITGETGAGKSIIIGALSLIMGARNDSSTLKDESKKCVVEAAFNIEEYGLNSFFEENGVDYESVAILRREALPGGKSRAFINDTPVNLNVLKIVAERLIDIHSQHQNLLIANPKFQLDVVDSVSDSGFLAMNYKLLFANYKKLLASKKTLVEQIEKQKSDEDYLKFQFEQLSSAKLQESEQVELEAELGTLTHIEEIKSNLTVALKALNGEELSLIVGIKDVQNAIKKINKFISGGDEFVNRIEALAIELKDITDDFDAINSKMEFEPDRLTFVSERLDLIYSLQKKHHVSTVLDLLDLKSSIEKKLFAISNFDSQLNDLEKAILVAEKAATTEAKNLSKKRASVFARIESTIVDQLKGLAIPNAEFKVNNVMTDQLTENGLDEINFLFSANKNGKLGEVSKVASGGEISRVMLCIKSLISNVKGLPTIIFDEIDTGVSGEVASKMGGIMEEMSAQIQVLSITHLPQIACRGKQHFKVFKTDNEQTTQTSVKQLSFEERVIEIAKMLSGKELSEAAMSNAKELLVGKV